MTDNTEKPRLILMGSRPTGASMAEMFAKIKGRPCTPEEVAYFGKFAEKMDREHPETNGPGNPDDKPPTA